MQIVMATSDRYAAIADLNRAAFGNGAEGALVARLRDDGLVLVERVVLHAGDVVGHILSAALASRSRAGRSRSLRWPRLRSVRTGSVRASAPVWCRTG
jgi:predicted N-acetyltransferase YhbS